MDHGHGGHGNNDGHGGMDKGPACSMHMLWYVRDDFSTSLVASHRPPAVYIVPTNRQEHADRRHLHRLPTMAHILALHLRPFLHRHHIHFSRIRIPPRISAQRRPPHRAGAFPREGPRQGRGEWAQ